MPITMFATNRKLIAASNNGIVMTAARDRDNGGCGVVVGVLPPSFFWVFHETDPDPYRVVYKRISDDMNPETAR